MSNLMENNTDLTLKRVVLWLSTVITILLILGWNRSVIADTQSDQGISQRLVINYSLAQAFEEKSLLAMSKADTFSEGFDDIAAHAEFRNALLYALEAQRWPLPKDKTAISVGSLQRLLDIKEHTLSSELFQTPHYIPGYDEPAVDAESLNGHSGGVYDIAYSPDGRFLASASSDKTIRLWNSNTGKTIRTINNNGFVSELAYSPDGRWIATGFDKNILIWDALSGKLLHTLEGHTESIHDIAYSPDGKTIASNAVDNTLRLWDAESGVLNKVIKIEQVTDIAFNPDGEKIIASQTWRGEVRVINLQSENTIQTLAKAFDQKIGPIIFSPNGKIIAGGLDGNSSTIVIWGAESGEVVSFLVDHHSTKARSIAISPDGTTLISSYYSDPSIFSQAQDHRFIAYVDTPLSTTEWCNIFKSEKMRAYVRALNKEAILGSGIFTRATGSNL